MNEDEEVGREASFGELGIQSANDATSSTSSSAEDNNIRQQSTENGGKVKHKVRIDLRAPIVD